MEEALKLALDLAIMHHSDGGYAELRLKVRQLAKEALAQDELCLSQEPSITKTGCGILTLHSGWDDLPDGTKFYTIPPKRPWVGLTNNEIEDCMEMSIQKTCRAIEAKLKEKNT